MTLASPTPATPISQLQLLLEYNTDKYDAILCAFDQLDKLLIPIIEIKPDNKIDNTSNCKLAIEAVTQLNVSICMHNQRLDAIESKLRNYIDSIKLL